MKLIGASLLFYLTSTTNFIYAQQSGKYGSVNWQPCPQQNGSTPTQCGTLAVPLDYSDTNPISNRTLDLQLVKVSAVNQPRKGSILFNPGGPGQSGRDIVGQLGNIFLIATGGFYDIIGFDPRGTGYTIPFSCYNDTNARTAALLAFPVLINSSDTGLGEVWAGRKAFAKACFESNPDNGELLGTAFVARDMIRIAEALDEDGLLRYWGFSYGTVLGATTAAMFPDKIDKMVLDGVTNSHQWYGGSAIEAGIQGDAVLNGFFEACLANPDKCLLAQDGCSVEDLLEKFYQRLYDLKFEPFVIGSDLGTDLINYNYIKGVTFQSLYSPLLLWPSLGTALHALLIGNTTSLAESLRVLPGGGGVGSAAPFSPSTPDASYGIQCGDTSLRSDNLTSLQPIIDATVAAGRITGENFVYLEPLSCAPWRFFAKERYSGNFQAQTKSPILFVGGPNDPATPLVSARNMSAGFEGSGVLQHNGYGHTSLAQTSLCTVTNIRAYFVDGILPPAGTICQPDQRLFSDDTTLGVLAPLANSTNIPLKSTPPARR